tara:strand:- start:1384 stop:2154 length:771 start_codon:yes stop_codon:yes gene_type:complete
MFQFAALVGASKSTGFQFCVPKRESYYDVNYKCYNRSIFDGFDIDCNIVSDEKKFKHEYSEPHFHYSPDIKNINDNTNITGYYQTEKYFDHCKQEILNYFTFKTEVKAKVYHRIYKGVYPDPKLCTSIHIRRGDYVQKQDYHPLLGPEYYKKACKKTDTEYYVIFSDDIDWCIEAFGKDKRLIYSIDEDPFEAMFHMSLCTNHIICNSSFGWWGSWLGEMASAKKESIIVAPSKWFGPAHSMYDPKDIIPDRWITI